MRRSVIIATLRSRIKEIDVEVGNLRQRQMGFEQALMIVEGVSSVVEVKRK